MLRDAAWVWVAFILSKTTYKQFAMTNGMQSNVWGGNQELLSPRVPFKCDWMHCYVCSWCSHFITVNPAIDRFSLNIWSIRWRQHIKYLFLPSNERFFNWISSFKAFKRFVVIFQPKLNAIPNKCVLFSLKETKFGFLV